MRYACSIEIREAEAQIAADNYASRQVAEKAGFAPVGTFAADDGVSMIRYQIQLPYP